MADTLTSTDPVLRETRAQIATITINRPDMQNTISPDMLDGLCEHLLAANADPDVRVIILTGAGRFFCAGLDLRGGGSAQNLTSDRVVTNLDLRNTPPTVLNKIDKPVICALGSAAGYGLDLALGCDIRIVSDRAKLSAAFVARGITPESGGTWLLPRLIGWSKAAELIFTGRVLDAEGALALGLVSDIASEDQLTDRARALATEIAANAPLAVQASKRMMRMGLDDGFEDHVHRVFLQLLPLLKTEDFREGTTAFMERRKPDFNGR